jgi:hypothetical protein
MTEKQGDDTTTSPLDPPAVDEPVLPVGSRDDSDRGWGADADDGRRSADWYRRERPPHHE